MLIVRRASLAHYNPEQGAQSAPRRREMIRVVNILRVASDLASILLRKEVIQPHLPVRLPCYDLALLAGLTLGAFPPCGLDTRLRVLSTQVA